MNDTAKLIVDDIKKKIGILDSLIKDRQDDIAEATKDLNRHEKERAEYLDVIEKLGGVTKHRVQWFNTDNLTDKYAAPVVVHGEGCNHIKVSQKDPYMKAGMEKVSDVEEWESPEAFAKDYNADFYAEDGPSGCWAIAFFPCTDMVERLTITTGYDDDNN